MKGIIIVTLLCLSVYLIAKVITYIEDFIEGDKPSPRYEDDNICGICGSKDVHHGGSWSPGGCNNCGAIYLTGKWYKE